MVLSAAYSSIDYKSSRGKYRKPIAIFVTDPQNVELCFDVQWCPLMLVCMDLDLISSEDGTGYIRMQSFACRAVR